MQRKTKKTLYWILLINVILYLPLHGEEVVTNPHKNMDLSKHFLQQGKKKEDFGSPEFILRHEKELSLTSEQKNKVEILKKEKSTEGIRSRIDLDKLEMELNAILAAEEIDIVKTDFKLEEIGKLTIKKRRDAILEIIETRKILTLEQIKILQILIKKK